jgi:hypothetical protein
MNVSGGDPDCDFFPIICTSNSEFFFSYFQKEEMGGDMAAWGGLQYLTRKEQIVMMNKSSRLEANRRYTFTYP